jgi:hypothetical protein
MLIKGTTRYVLPLPHMGIVIKLPIIRLGIACEALYCILREKRGGRLKWLYSEIFEFTPEMYGSLKRFLFLGAKENWEEFLFSQEMHKRAPIRKTFFSFLGLCNVQRYGEPLEIEEGFFSTWWKQLVRLFGNDTIRDGHHFENTNNFCREKDALIFLDYGSRKTQNIIRKHTPKFFTFFKDTDVF